MKILGIDIGFGFTKATNGRDTLVFKSLFGDASDLQFWMDFGPQGISDFFNVTIDGRSYFIGDLAEQQSNVLNFTLDQEKLITFEIENADSAALLTTDDGYGYVVMPLARDR